jgi:hypothetical protein
MEGMNYVNSLQDYKKKPKDGASRGYRLFGCWIMVNAVVH